MFFKNEILLILLLKVDLDNAPIDTPEFDSPLLSIFKKWDFM